MGWLIVIIIKPLITAIPTIGFVYLIAGGLAYIFGIVFYVWKRLAVPSRDLARIRSCRQHLSLLFDFLLGNPLRCLKTP